MTAVIRSFATGVYHGVLVVLGLCGLAAWLWGYV